MPPESIILAGVRPYGEEIVDLVIRSGFVVDIAVAGRADRSKGVRVIDAEGLIALPAFVDLHAHTSALAKKKPILKRMVNRVVSVSLLARLWLFSNFM